MAAQKPNYFVDRKHLILRIRTFLVRMHQKELFLGKRGRRPSHFPCPIGFGQLFIGESIQSVCL